MKRCPECRRDYYDDSLLYCLDDGTALLEGPATADPGGTATAILNDSDARTAILNSRDSGAVRSERTGSRSNTFLVAGLVLLIIGGAAVGMYFYRLRTGQKSFFASSQDLKLSRLTDSGKISDIAISPDRRYVAYVQLDNGKKSIRLRQTATTSDVEIVPAVETDLLNLSFSRDGNYLYYVNYVQNAGTLYMVPALGGGARKILFDIDSRAAVSHDGKQIAYLRFEQNGGCALLIASADGSNERTFVDYPTPSNSFVGAAPAWSPDDRSLACPVATPSSLKVYSFLVADGARSTVNEQDWEETRDIDWLSDGDIVVAGVAKSTTDSGSRQLWLLSKNKPPTRITNDLSDYLKVSSTANGDAIATIQDKRVAAVWTAPDNDAKRAQQVGSIADLRRDVVLTPDGSKIILSSRTGANIDISIMNADGSDRKQLTQNQGNNDSQVVTPDGRYIVFRSDRNETAGELYRMNIDGTGIKQLTTSYSAYPTVTPDGKWVVFAGSSGGDNKGPVIAKVSIDGGDPIRVFDNGYRMSMSPIDGSIAAEVAGTGDDQFRRDLIILPLNGGQPTSQITLPSTIGLYERVVFTPDGKALAYIDTRNGSSNIWTIPLSGKAEPKPLTSFTDQRIFGFGWSAGGNKLVAVRGNEIQDAVLLSDNKQQ